MEKCLQNLFSCSLRSKNLKIKISRTIILTVVLYGCETWLLALRKYRRLRVSENRVLRRLFWPKGNEVTGERKRLRNKKLNDLYSSPKIIRVIKSRRMKWAGHVARMGERRGVCRILVGKPEGKRPLGNRGVDGGIIFRWIFRKWNARVWTGSSWLRIGTGGGHL